MNNDRFKFRVWDFVKKKMHYFDLFEYSLDQDSSYGCYEFPTEQDFENGEAILLQSAGLKDKNGKLIYEGDIILQKANWSDGEQWDIYTYVAWGVIDGEEYTSGMGWVQNKIKIQNIKDGRDFKGRWGLRNFDGEGLSNFEAEIIGNIYENPEMLEARKK